MELESDLDLNVEYCSKSGEYSTYNQLNSLEDYFDDDNEVSSDDDNLEGNYEIDEPNSFGDESDDEREADDDNEVSLITPPYVTMTFESTEAILHHYHEYGKVVGFQIRVRSSERKVNVASKADGYVNERNRHINDYSDFKRLRLVCTKEGKFESKSKNPRRPTSTTVTGCQFKVNACVCPDGSWKLTTVVLKHDHPCMPEN